MLRLILAARALRAFTDGFVAVLLPAYLLALGHGELAVGLLSTATLLGSALATLAVGLSKPDSLRAMFAAYAAIGVAVLLLYARIPAARAGDSAPAAPLGPSRRIVWRLAALFSVDAFAGGLLVNALLALWLFQKFGMTLAAAGAFFFWTGLLGACSQLAAPALARRIGLVHTMVFTHIPASLFLIAAAFAPDLASALACLLARSALSQMDVPVRSAFVMSVVTPAERPAAASFTAVPRSLASATGPSMSGVLLAGGALAAPLVACGVLKIAYDLALLAAFRRHEPMRLKTSGQSR